MKTIITLLTPTSGSIKPGSATSSPPLSFQAFGGATDYDDDDSLDGLIHLCSQDHTYEPHFEPHLATSNSQDSIDFDEYLSYSATQQEPFHEKNFTPHASAYFQRSVSADGESNSSPVRSCEQSNVDASPPLAATDIPFIISQLPSPLHSRFMEKFAESAGRHFCDIMADPDHGLNPFSDNQYGSRNQFEGTNNSAAQQHTVQDILQLNIDAQKPASNTGGKR